MNRLACTQLKRFCCALVAALFTVSGGIQASAQTIASDDLSNPHSLASLTVSSSNNLLTNGSFESAEFDEQPLSLGQAANLMLLNRWLVFNNEFAGMYVFEDDPNGVNASIPDDASEGSFMARIVGPFTGSLNSSGMLQNVTALPGDVLQASIDLQTSSGDSILGTSNFTELRLEFIDSNGNIIPGNTQSTTIIDGLDPNAPSDTWVNATLSATAPAGTTVARFVFLFTQPNSGIGSVWLDNALLMQMYPIEVLNQLLATSCYSA